jgi:flagellar protein FlaG
VDISAINPKAAALVTAVPAASQATFAENRDLIQAVRAINETEFLGSDNELSFARDQETGRPVIRIVDRTTKEVIRQVPSEYILRVAQDLRADFSRRQEVSR